MDIVSTTKGDIVEFEFYTDDNKLIGTIGIGNLPRRKNACLYFSENGVVTPIAYIHEEKHAHRLIGLLTKVATP